MGRIVSTVLPSLVPPQRRDEYVVRSVWCRRAMIPGKISTSFSEFQGIVSVNDFGFPRRLQELLCALLHYLRNFRLTWVGLYPLCCQVLYHHSVAMNMSSDLCGVDVQ